MSDGMDVDVDREIEAVDRAVRAGVSDARSVVISRTYDTTVEDLWDACTDPARIGRWFLPVSGELRLGGRYQLEGNAGGVVEACDPPNGFRATWEYGGEMSWISVRFVAVDGGTAWLDLEHIAPLSQERWGEFGPGAVGLGWELGLLGLGLYLATGEEVDRAVAERWMGSPDGRRFMGASSEGWCEAAVLGGDDPEAARAAADRTRAAYTGAG